MSFVCFSVNNPIPSNLKSEAKKAAKILREFTEISNRNGPDKLIPGNRATNCPVPCSKCVFTDVELIVLFPCVSAHVIAKAEGLAIISVIKAGFMITARGGSGIVIARLADRRKRTRLSDCLCSIRLRGGSIGLIKLSGLVYEKVLVD